MVTTKKANELPKTVVLLHVDTSELVAEVIGGRPYKIAAGEPMEVTRHVGKAIIKHIGHLHGIVEVNQIRTKTGVQWDVEEAKTRAAAYLIKCEKEIVDFYVRQQMEDRVGGGKPALPPTGRALIVIQARGVNLKRQYGLAPIGWSDPGEGINTETSAASAADKGQIDALKAHVQEQNATISVLQDGISDLQESVAMLTEMVKNQQAPAEEVTS